MSSTGPHRVHCVHDFGTGPLDDLRTRLGDGVVLTVGPEALEPGLVRTLIAGRPERRQLEALTGLRHVVVPWAGIALATQDLVGGFPQLTLHNIHHNAGPTAEHAVALLLAAARRLVPSDRRMRDHDWRDRGRGQPALYLSGRKGVVVGLGAIGTRVATALRGLGMDVVGVRSAAAPGQIDDGVPVVGVADLHSVLPGARAVVVCVPLTRATEGLLGADELALLGADAVVVNVARGPVIDEAALFDALAAGRLHGAGLDVWWRYPREGEERTAPSAHPYESLDNVVLSPHRAGHTDATEALRSAALAELLLRLGGS